MIKSRKHRDSRCSLAWKERVRFVDIVSVLKTGGQEILHSHLKGCKSYSLLKDDFKKGKQKKIQESQLSLSKINEAAMATSLPEAFDEFFGQYEYEL